MYFAGSEKCFDYRWWLNLTGFCAFLGLVGNELRRIACKLKKCENPDSTESKWIYVITASYDKKFWFVNERGREQFLTEY